MTEVLVNAIKNDARPDITLSLDAIRQALEGMRFGAITITVHDARIVQLDVTEKRRFAS